MPDKKCPRCGLWSTASALRCDCGYDFTKGTVEESYNKLELRQSPFGFFRIFYIMLIMFNLIGGGSSLSRGLTAENVFYVGILVIWSIVVYWLTSKLYEKKNWARIMLFILCPPLGLYLFTSKEINLYMLQK